MIDHFREQHFFSASDSEMEFYERMLPTDHRLCQLVDSVDFEIFRPVVEGAYSDHGQPTGYAMIVFKLEILKYFYNLSDRGVIERAATDVAFRWFIRLPIDKTISDHTLLTRFRGRLGKEGYEKIFQRLIAEARKEGIVKDKLRLKDATHILANISIPSTLSLLAQMREHLLKLIESIDQQAAQGYWIALETIRQQTSGSADSIRLNQRIELFEDILRCFREKLEKGEVPSEKLGQWQPALELGEKIFSQKKQGKSEREIRSLVDPEAMRGKHGVYYDGYVLDVAMDADSELITAINVLVAGGKESQGALTLLEQETSVHGNHIEGLSIDGAGYDGAMIQRLEDSQAKPTQVFVPPRKQPINVSIGPQQFELTTTSDGQEQVRCPQGKYSHYRQSDGDGTIFRFTKETCESCPLLKQCCNKSENPKFGRSVRKSDFEKQYERVRARSQTAEFKEVRRRHPAIERKLNECVNHHGARKARYRGSGKIAVQMLGVGLVTNLKRIANLVRLHLPSNSTTSYAAVS